MQSCRALVAGPGRPIAGDLTWIDVDEREGREALAAWCQTVGPAVYAEPDSRTPEDTGIESLAVVSWNTHVGGADLPTFVGALRSGTLTNGRPPHDFVLLLQEAFRAGSDVPDRYDPGAGVPGRITEMPPNGRREDVVRAARDLGLFVFYVPSMRNGRETGQQAEDRGNAILSTKPLSALTAIELPFDHQRRVAITAVLDGADADGRCWRLRVGSTHLDARAGVSRLWAFASGRRGRQAKHLAQVLDDGVPTVLGSDLNTWAGASSEPAYVRLSQVFPDTTSPGYGATFKLGLQLDYMFFRLPEPWRRDAARRVDERFGSDHHPLVAWVFPLQAP
jgi:endonuclease/exonuclease/phosphatase family metal-dependent hydrolase